MPQAQDRWGSKSNFYAPTADNSGVEAQNLWTEAGMAEGQLRDIVDDGHQFQSWGHKIYGPCPRTLGIGNNLNGRSPDLPSVEAQNLWPEARMAEGQPRDIVDDGLDAGDKLIARRVREHKNFEWTLGICGLRGQKFLVDGRRLCRSSTIFGTQLAPGSARRAISEGHL